MQLKAAARKYAHGRLLDIGCGVKPYERYFDGRVTGYIGIEHDPDAGYRGDRADIVADAADLPIRDGSYDTVLCTEVLEHVPDPDAVVDGIARVLQTDGVAIIGAPFVYPVHDRFDFFRYSPAGLSILFERHDLEVAELQPLSYPPMTVAIMAGITIHELCFVRSRYAYALSLPLRPLLWLIVATLNLIGWAGEWLRRADNFAFNHLLVAKKTKVA